MITAASFSPGALGFSCNLGACSFIADGSRLGVGVGTQPEDNVGIIVGATIGAIVGLIVLIVIIILCVKYCKRREPKEKPPPASNLALNNPAFAGDKSGDPDSVASMNRFKTAFGGSKVSLDGENGSDMSNRSDPDSDFSNL